MGSSNVNDGFYTNKIKDSIANKLEATVEQTGLGAQKDSKSRVLSASVDIMKGQEELSREFRNAVLKDNREDHDGWTKWQTKRYCAQDHTLDTHNKRIDSQQWFSAAQYRRRKIRRSERNKNKKKPSKLRKGNTEKWSTKYRTWMPSKMRDRKLDAGD